MQEIVKINQFWIIVESSLQNKIRYIFVNSQRNIKYLDFFNRKIINSVHNV